MKTTKTRLNSVITAVYGTCKSYLRFRILALLGLIFIGSNLSAQLDTLHYIPPFGSGTSNNELPGDMHLYITTAFTTPVNYTITDASGNTVLQTGTVVSGTPVRYDSNGLASGVAVGDADLNQVLSSDVGFKITSDEFIYVNARIRSADNAQAGSLTSKGTNAFGTDFRLGSIPNLQGDSNKATTFGITATEDDTDVTIDLVGSGVILEGTTPPNTASVITVTLQEGESYVMRCEANISTNNWDGMIGGHVTSDKPIVVNSGSWNGEPTNSGGRDYAIDQIVGADKIGVDYIFVRAGGGDDREVPMIVANTDGTQIFVNGSLTAIQTIDAGEYYTINGSNYVNDVMFVNTSEESFAYQILAGNDAGNTAGMNFVPDLSCQVDSVIDAIPDVNLIGSNTFSGGLTITTFAGSDIFRNGILETATPETVTLTNGDSYDIYRLTGLTGDQEIRSSTIAIVSFFGVSGVAGYGGYFSGFERPQSITIEPDAALVQPVEGCALGLFAIERAGDTSIPITADIVLSGTATVGVDYDIFDLSFNPIGSQLNYDPDETVKYVIVQAYGDAIIEGTETVQLNFEWLVCNEIQTASQSLTIEENTIELTCQNDTTIFVAPGTCSTQFDFTPAIADSYCTVNLSQTDGSGLVSGDQFPLGTTTIEWTGESSDGTISDVCSFDVTVSDNEAPLITCPSSTPITPSSVGSCDGTLPDLSSILSATDNCTAVGNLLYAQVPPVGTVLTSAVDVDITVTDESGNSVTCTVTAQVDTTAPSVSCLADQTINTGLACGTNVPDYAAMLTISDDCSSNANLIINQSPPFGAYITTSQVVTITVIDQAGNSNDCTFNLILTGSDFDGDGICDDEDLDDDNDGILDEIECDCQEYDMLVPLYSEPSVVSLTGWSQNANASYEIIESAGQILKVNAGVNTITTNNTDAAITDVSNTITAAEYPAMYFTYETADGGNNTNNRYAFGWSTTSNQIGTNTFNPIAVRVLGAELRAYTDDGTLNGIIFGLTAGDKIGARLLATGDLEIYLNDVLNTTINGALSDLSATLYPTLSIDYGRSRLSNLGSGSSLTAVTAALQPSGDYLGSDANTYTLAQILTYNRSCNTAYTCDFDSDGNPNHQDLDADNDGVYDQIESSCVYTPEDLTWHGTAAANVTNPSAGVLDVSGSAWSTAYSDQTFSLPIEITGDISSVSNGMIGFLPVSGTEVTGGNWNDGGYKVQIHPSNGMRVRHAGGNIGWIAPGATGTTFRIAIDINGNIEYYHNGSLEHTDVIPVEDLKISVSRGAFNLSSFRVLNQSRTSACWDLDGDLSPNFLDLDSDADGCNDVVEGVFTDDNFDGILGDFPVTTNLQGEVTSGVDGYTTPVQTNGTDYDFLIAGGTSVAISCPANQTVSANASCESILIDYTNMAVVVPSCPNPYTVTQSPAAGTAVSGVTVVTLTVTDSLGNTDSCAFTVTVEDDTAPVVACSDQDVNYDTNCQAFLPDFGATLTISDNCSANVDLLVTQFPPAGTEITGVQTVSMTIEDEAGNVQVCSFNASPVDVTSPALSGCPGNQTINADASCAAIMPDFTATPTATDNCSVTVTQSPLAGSTISGTTTVTITATDGTGNTSDCSFDIVVIDTTAPATPVLADVTGQCTATAVAPTTTDNCDGVITGTTTDALTHNTQGTHVITWTFEDAAGNTTIATQNVIIDDTTAPVTPVLADVTGECAATAVAPTTTDNCAGTITGTTSDPLSYTTQGTYTITWNFDDGNGNDINVTQTVVVDDTTAPVTPVLADITGECTGTAAVPTTTDACAGTVTGTTSDATTYSTQGTHVITWTFDDGNGNVTTANQNVIIQDVTDPVVTCPADVTEDFDAGCEFTLLDYTSGASATDNCSSAANITLTQSPVAGTVITGNTVVTITAEDEVGNTDTCTFNVNVNDTTAPATPVLADVTGQCTATAVAPTTTDNCDGTITGTTTDALTYNTQGTHVITWTFEDAAGNSTIATQNVIINDTTAPVTPVLADVTGECAATAVAPTTTDNCAGTITGTTSDPLSYTAQGTYTITWNFDDGNGNDINVTQTVVVDDTTAPVTPVLADITGECTGTAAVPTTTDACAGTVTGTTSDATTYSTQGTHVITWSFDDGNGNVTTANQNVIIQDVTVPVVTCPADVTENFDTACQFTLPDYTSGASATDNCSSVANITFTQSPTAGTVITGNTVITITAEDEVGNTDSCTFNVTVNDTTDPATPTLADVTGQCTATAVAPTTTDNCDGTITGTTTDATTYSTQGTHVITWTFEDAAGNSTIATQNVIINDTTAPVTPVLADVTGECAATAVAPTTTDNCAGTITGTTSDPLSYTAQGTYTITWNFDDGNGNDINVTQTVIVDDVTAPVTPVLADITAECTGTAAVPTTTDACAGTVTGTTSDATTYSTQGTHVITWTFDDGNGNVTTANQNVIIQDVTDPVVTCQADVTEDFDAGCEFTLLDYTSGASATDNCSSAANITLTQSPVAGTVITGNTVVTITAEDEVGNTDTCTFNVNVNDTTAPATPVLADVTGQCTATAVAPTTTDNCDGVITGTTTDALTHNTQGTHVITWTFEDAAGNSTTANQNVIIDDTTNPATPALANVTGECTATAVAPTTTDNCAGTITGTTTDALTYTAQGTHVITWTFDDGNGNVITVNQNVIIDDTTDPATPTLADITAECTAAAAVPTTTDVCAGTVTGTTSDATTYSTQGTHVITWTFDDGNGNVTTANQNVIIQDVTDPVVTCPGDVTEDFDASCQFTLPDYTSGASATDNCSSVANITLTQSPVAGTVITGNTVVTITAEDEVGNTDTCTFNVNVNDTTAPATPVLADVTGQCTATAAAPTTTDNCDGTITGTTTDALTYNTQGTHVITWTFEDAAGNTTIATQNVIIDDTTAPVTPVLADVTGECAATAVAPTTTDNCAGTITGTTSDPLSYTAQGTYTITWNFDDGNGNDINVTQTVIVDDTTAPVTPVLADITAECTGTAAVPTTTDACAGTVTGTTSDPATYSAQGTHVIEWTFDDGNGNVITVNQNVIIQDVTDPVVTCPGDVTEDFDGSCQFTLPDYTSGASATDNCSSVANITLTQSPVAGTVITGNTVVTITAEDEVGNTDTCTFNVNVNDTTAPATPVLADVTGQCTATAAAPTTTDNCDGVLTGTTSDATTYSTQGTHVITWTFTDANGNSVTANQNVVITDTTDPATPTLSDVTGQCTATATAPTTTDNCAGTITGTTSDALTYSTQGTHVITWTFDDGNGNVITETQNVVIDDTVDPVTPTLADITAECTAAAVVPTTTDACAGTVTGTTSDATTYSTQGTHVITWTFDDGNGNVITETQNVIITDTTDPVVTCPSDVTENFDASCQFTLPDYTSGASATDNCSAPGAITFTQSPTAGTVIIGNTVITITAEDEVGNTDTCTFNVTVNDTTDPATPTLANVTGQCTATASAPTTTDNCDGVLTGTTSDATTYSTQGTHVITWTFTDANGNSVTANQNVVITDTTDPATPTLSDVTGQCTATATAPTTTDNCAGTITGTTSDALTYSTQGTHVITWTFDDGNGNVITETQNVVIDDTVDPVTPTLADITAECTAAAVVPTTTDACAGTVTGTTSDATTYSTQGTHVITWTFDDGNGNVITETQNVIITDTTDPVVTCPSDVTENFDASCQFTLPDYTSGASATDNCSAPGAITFTQSPTAGTVIIGNTVITITAEDEVGNTDTCTFNVTLNDTTDPATPTLANVTGQCTATASAPTTTDNCDGVLTGTTSDATTYSTQGTHVITWTFTDASGNSITANQNVIIDDTTDPVAVCQPATISLDGAGIATVTPGLVDGGSTDNCGTPTLSVTPNTFNAIGTYTVTLTATDAEGNTSDCTVDIEVNDDQGPTPLCQDITIQLDGSGNATIVGLDIDGGSTDNGVIASYTASQTAFDCTNLGTNTVTLTVTDDAGNSASCDATVTVEDSIDPTLTTQDITIQLDGTGVATITPSDVTSATADNCGTPTVTVDVDTFDCTVTGANTVNVTSTDGSGNSVTETATVTVEDTVLPQITCPSDITVSNDAGVCEAVVTYAAPVGTDNCSSPVTTLTAGLASGATFPLGTTVVTYQVTDASGNTADCSFNVTVNDTEQPTVACPADITVDFDASCEFTLADYTSGATASDNCSLAGDIVLTQSPAAGTVITADQVITITAEDEAGNTQTCTFNVTTQDTTLPAITCPSDITVSNDAGVCGAVVTYTTPVGTDNCASPVTTMTAGQASGTQFPVGTTTVTYQVTDASGNTVDCSFTVTVNDTEAPVAVCQDIIIDLGAGSVSIDQDDINGGSTDNCGVIVQPLTQTYTAIGTYTETLTVTDAAGNTSTCDATVEVEDNQGPTPLCQDITIQLDGSGNATIVGLDIDGGSTDNGVIASYTASQTAFDCTNLGTNTVTLTVTDDAGNSASCDATVTVEDSIDPTLTTQDITIQLDGTGVATITPSDVTNTTADNCGTPTVTVDIDTFDCTVTGANTVNVTSTDGSGNSVTETATVTVEDTVLPQITCPADITVSNDAGVCEAVVTYAAPVGTDNCSSPVTTLTAGLASGATFPLGTTVVTYQVTDASGNTADCSFNVTVNDTEQPTVACPADITVDFDASCEFTLADYTSGATASDNCSLAGDIVLTQSPAAGTVITADQVITITAEDEAGNTNTCTFNVTTQDTTLPAITCPSDITVSNDAGVCGAVVTYTTPVGTDNCASPVTTMTAGQASGTQFPVGTTTVTYQVTDASGNTVDCSFTVTVNDTEAPVAVCQDIIIDLGAGSVSIDQDDINGGSTDNCGVIVQPLTQTYTAIGTYTETLTVTDAAGNTSTCDATVEVEDNQGPTPLCQDITIQLDGSGNATIVGLDIDGGSTDNGVIASYTASQTAFDCTNLGTNTVTLTVTDDAGNSASCDATVTVEDSIDPTLTTQDITIQLDGTGVATITPSDVTNTTADNCGTPTVTVDIDTFDCTVTGANTVNVTSTDGSGNSVTETATVTVEDTVLPQITCPADITVSNDAGVCEAVVTYAAPVGTDNCSSPVTILTAGLASGATFPLGTTVVTYQVTDASGNTADCSFNVTVNDTEQPTVACPADITVDFDASCEFTLADYTSGATASDNCSLAGDIVLTQSPAAGTVITADQVIMITAEDEAGNAQTCTFNVTTQDTTNPTLTCPSDISASNDAGICGATITYATPVGTDNCSGATTIMTAGQASGTIFPIGNTTVTYEVTDASGNTVDCSFTVTVNDTEAPVAVCQIATINLDGVTGIATLLPTDIDGGSTDNCGIVTYLVDGAASVDFNADGTYNVTLSVTDAEGNSASCNVDIEVTDITAPTPVCQDITIQLDGSGNATIVGLDIDGGSTDNGFIVSYDASQTTFDCTDLGTNTVTLTVTDDGGNSSTCDATVTVEDSIDPTLTTQDITIQLDGSGNATITPSDVTNTTADNCGTPTVTVDIDTFDCTVTGANTVNVTSTDGSGNSVTETATVTVEDTVLPQITCPADITVSNDAGVCEAVVTYAAPVGTDNCSSPVTTLTAGLASGATFPLGTTVVTYQVTDASGNTADCSFNVTVNDTEQPTVACPADITVDFDASCEFTLADYTSGATASDNCSLAGDIVLTQSPAAGTVITADQVIMITAEDEAGNAQTCTFNVTTQDTTNPTLTCPSDISASNDAGICGATITYATPVGTDNCSGATTIMTAGQASGTIFPIGNTTVTYEVTDASGNTVDCSFTITVNDTEAPVANCQTATISLDSGTGIATLIPSDLDASSTDNCGIVTYLVDGGASVDYNADGTYNVILTVIDAAGNSTDCNVDVTVTDITPPVPVCQDITIQLDANGEVTITGADIDGGSTDNGVIVSTTASQTDFDCSDLGTNTVTLTVTDDGGNSSTCDATVTVEDNIAPAATCQDITIQLDGSGNATITGADVDGGSTDNCTIATLDVDQANFDCSNLGANTVTLTVTDQSGNATTCTSTVIVEDTETPVITCPADITVNNDLGICGAVVNYATPVGTDNCTGVTTVMTSGLADGDTFPVGTTIVSYRVEDTSGNFAECSFTVTVIDNEQPVITCPLDQVEIADANCEFLLGDYTGLLTATDNCTAVGDLVVVQNPAPGTIVAGTTTVTITVSDEVNNISECAFDVIVEDAASPIITECVANQTISLDTNCETVLQDYTGGITVTDNCTSIATLIITQSPVAGTVFSDHNTVIPVTVTVEDESGNTTNCTFDVTLIDDTLPTITCPAEQILSSDANCEAVLPDYIALGTYTDNCSALGDMIITQSPVPGTTVAGTTAVTITVTDAAGNTTDCTFNAVVIDDVQPFITCLANQTLDSTPTCDAALPDYTGMIIAADNCSAAGDITITQNPVAGTIVSATSTVTFTAEDEAGNIITCDIQVEVIDVIDPVITVCATDETLLLDATCEHVLGDYTSLITSEDNCSLEADITLVQTPAAGTVFSGHGTVIPVTIEATDEAGNSTTCMFEVTLEDTTAPILTCPADQTVSANTTCEFLVEDYLALAVVTDNCSAVGDITLTQSPVAGETVSGTTTVTVEATDLQGNVTTCTFELIVVDTTAPIIVACAPDVTEQVDAACEFALADYTALSTVTDNCTEVLTATQTPAPGTLFSGDETEIVVNINYEDASGNSTDCQFTVTLEDSIAPSLECPANKVLFTNTECEYVIEDFTSEGVAMDNCTATGDIVITQTPVAGTVISGENTIQTITLTAADLAGNETTCQFVITLSDNIAPEITCGEDVTVFGDAACQYLIEDYTGNAVATDNCDTDVVITQEPAVGTVLTGHGTTQVITLTATDNFGNQTSCEFLLTVVDNTDPEITCIEDQILNAVADCTAELPDYMPQILTSDNCIETTLVQTPAPGTVLAQGNTTVTMTVTDINGNTQSCSFNVEVVDITPPVVTCPPNMTVENDLGECGAIVEYTLPGATDNCAVQTIELTGGIESGEQFPLGDTTLEVTVTDTSGNITTCTFIVTVIDTESPVIECPADTTVIADETCTGTIEEYRQLLQIADNCSSEFTVTQTPEAGTQVQGEQIVTFSVIDESGNESTCEILVTVIDITPPSIVCPDDISQAENLVFYDLPEVTDNCGAEILMVEGLESGDEFAHGYTPVVFVATDAYMNTDTCSFMVLINNAPVGVNDSLLLESHEDDVVVNVLDNDIDIDGDVLILTDAWTSSNDTEVWIEEDGTIEYQVYDEWCGTDTITYNLCDGYGACDQAYLIIEVECFNGVSIPEGFSPNGDGINDALVIPGILHYPDCKLQIFSRWGREVYSMEFYQNDWEGLSMDGLNFGNGRLPEGTYYVLLNLGDGSDPLKTYIYLRY